MFLFPFEFLEAFSRLRARRKAAKVIIATALRIVQEEKNNVIAVFASERTISLAVVNAKQTNKK